MPTDNIINNKELKTKQQQNDDNRNMKYEICQHHFAAINEDWNAARNSKEHDVEKKKKIK